MAKKEGINIPVGVDLRDFLKGMGLLEDNLLKIPKNTKPAKNAFDDLARTYRSTMKDAQALAIMEGTQSAAFKEAASSAQALKTQLDGVHAAVGVGMPQQVQKAAGGFNMLSHSVNQITRELPAFTYSMQTGFMAISNNIPMLFDEITKITTANKTLIADGKAAPSVFSTLSSSILTWGTALSVGVTALTVLGPQMVNYIGQLDEAADASKRLADSTKNLVDQENKILNIVGKTNDLRLEAMKEGREKENALALNSYKKGIIELEDAYVKGEIVDMTYQQRKESLWQIYQNKLTDITKKGVKERAEWTFGTYDKDLQSQDKNNEGIAAQKELWTGKFDVSTAAEDLSGLTEEINAFSIAMRVAGENHEEFMEELEKSEARVKALKEAFGLMAVSVGSDLAEGLGKAVVGAQSTFDDLYGMFAKIASEAANIMFMMGSALILAPGTQSIAMGYFAAGAGLKFIAGMLGGMSSGQSSGGGAVSSGSNNQMGGSFTPNFQGTQYLMLDGKVRGQDLIIATSNTNRDNRRVR